MANRDDGENDGKYESSYGGRDGWYRDGFASSCRTIDSHTL